MIYNFHKKATLVHALTTPVGVIKTSIGENTGFTVNINGDNFKIYYHEQFSWVVIEDDYSYIMEISLNEI